MKEVSRRHFLKYCAGSAAVLGLEYSILGTVDKLFAAETASPVGPVLEAIPTYPIATDIFTTLDKTIIPLHHDKKTLVPRQVSKYAENHYGEWDGDGPGFAYLRPDMETGDAVESVPDPDAATLASFFTISDVHIADKESPAQCIYVGYEYPEPMTPDGPAGNSSAYSAVVLYTTHVLDAAVQTINALHKTMPFDCGIALGDAANNTQYNELRWYIDVLDGKLIQPSSGSHRGADEIEYQKPYQAAGLDKSIKWYQTIGNHDQFWMGSTKVTNHLRRTYVGNHILNTGAVTSLPPDFPEIMSQHGFYMGVVNGWTKYGEIIGVGAEAQYPEPPRVVADPDRRSLAMREWMSEFLNTTSKPRGHGFTQQAINQGFACYHFYPRADIPLKVIVLDDTDRDGCGAAAALDHRRYNWLVQELEDGEAAGELMIICAHIPIRPYAAPQDPPPADNPLYPYRSLFTPQSDISEDELLTKLHTYKNLVLWIAGHMHRNTITPQPDPGGDPEKGFWEVETPSLRDFPQQFRRFEIVRNSDNNISILALDVDTAANPTPLAGGEGAPPWTSRSYAIATRQIFKNQVCQGPNVNPASGVYNAELVKQLSPAMRAKLAQISPAVVSFTIDRDAASTAQRAVTLNNTVIGTAPTHYMASESSDFGDAQWMPYAKAPVFALAPIRTPETRTVYFKVKDRSGAESPVVNDSIAV